MVPDKQFGVPNDQTFRKENYTRIQIKDLSWGLQKFTNIRGREQSYQESATHRKIVLAI